MDPTIAAELNLAPDVVFMDLFESAFQFFTYSAAGLFVVVMVMLFWLCISEQKQS
jgi:hypothetical protein